MSDNEQHERTDYPGAIPHNDKDDMVCAEYVGRGDGLPCPRCLQPEEMHRTDDDVTLHADDRAEDLPLEGPQAVEPIELGTTAGQQAVFHALQPYIADRREVRTEDGRILIQYRMQYFNRDGFIWAEEVVIRGAVVRVPVSQVMTIDTGRRTLASYRKRNGLT